MIFVVEKGCSDTKDAVMKKRAKFLYWKKTDDEGDRIAYTTAKKKANRPNVLAKIPREEGRSLEIPVC